MGLLAQKVECRIDIAKVVGALPTGPTMPNFIIFSINFLIFKIYFDHTYQY